jgi:hypothetical protein
VDKVGGKAAAEIVAKLAIDRAATAHDRSPGDQLGMR